ncbi:hypothetical protein CRV01_06865 [Arcobacter sp. CECT 8983]|uniref:sirohydrochlorin chelatase n=1 Tax=Arcobacter sp. CECT 8983 TaxID=2044508 RepID=UPI00100BE769|nr:CbiX/SirB N-terminal domain-containing protein [Arcobacter sp. CECT 8983]RXJ90861.1 hypothetical protein CRV01_06865 [Arcobacter sp. CECT 8983]
MRAIIFVAHGSKKEESNEEFIQLIEKISHKDNKYGLKKAAFLELASPDIKSVVTEFIINGAREIVFYPYFLNSGKHVTSDIPNIIENLRQEHKNIMFKLLPHFGKSEKIEDIILHDINRPFV